MEEWLTGQPEIHRTPNNDDESETTLRQVKKVNGLLRANSLGLVQLTGAAKINHACVYHYMQII